MSKTICRICLRTDIEVHDINEDLVDYHDEITEFAIYENTALKYCLLCEHLLKKCYLFSQKCRKAIKILKEVKIKKKGYPSNLHIMLQPSLEFSTPDTLKQFDLIDGNLIPLSAQLAVVKQENNTDDEDLGNNDCAVDTLQLYFEEDDDHKRFAKFTDIVFEDEKPKENMLNDREEILNLNSLNVKVKTEDSLNDEDVDEDLSATNVTTEINQNLSDTDLLKELNDDSSDKELLKEFTKQGLHEDASDTEKYRSNDDIKELMTEIKKGSKRKLKVRKAPKIPTRKPLPSKDEIEKVFEVQLFATDQEAREELEIHKNSEYFLSAEHKCEICFSVFKHAKVLDYHMRWHDVSVGTHECDICHMRFKSRLAMKSHSNESHSGRFQCKKCSLVTYHRIAMLKHYEKHLGIVFDCKIWDHTFNESTKASTTEVQNITSRKKTNAQRCREYRERKKLQNTLVQNITAERSDECSGTDQLQAKKPKTNAERRKKHYEAQKLKKQLSKKIPKTVKQINKEYYERKKKIKALNTLNHHSDAHLSTYNSHVLLQHRSEHVCVSCARTFVSEKGLIAHRRAIHNTKSLVDSDATTPC